jgi:hypothetical protein
VAQQDASADPAPVGESAPAFPPQRDPETPAARPVPVPAPRPEESKDPDRRPEEPRDPDRQPAPTGTEAAAPATASAATEGTRLGARERAVLDFERRRWKHAGAKEQAIRDTFDLSATRYYQILNALLDEPAALAYAPALVGRLRRIRDARRRARR